MEEFALLHALDDSVGWRAGRLREVERDQAASVEAGPSERLESIIARLQRALRPHQRAILETDVRAIGHRLIFDPHVSA